MKFKKNKLIHFNNRDRVFIYLVEHMSTYKTGHRTMVIAELFDYQRSTGGINSKETNFFYNLPVKNI